MTTVIGTTGTGWVSCCDPVNNRSVAIIGGGISGLTAARALCRKGFDVRLFEREQRCGGVIRTDRVGEFVIDVGPDTLLTHKPAAIALARELGLADSLVDPLPRRSTYVVRRRALRSLPDTSAMGLPTNWRTLVGASAFSFRGKLRMAAEALLPPRRAAGDESIGSFVRRRFGREAVEYVAEPLLAGIHRGDASRLSLRALFPFLAEAENRHGSVTRAWRTIPSRPGRAGPQSLRDGLGGFVAELSAQLPPGVASTGSEVTAIERDGCGFGLRLADGGIATARTVLLATPAHVASRLVSGIDAELASLCAGIRYVSVVNVALGYARADVAHPLEGAGFVVPVNERHHVRSVSWVSSKWPGRAPNGSVLLRASLDDGSAPDQTLIEWAHEDLRDLLGLAAPPALARVYRLPLAMPQLEVGHLDRMAAIDRHLSALPGLFITASGFRGVGLPDCITDAQTVADRLMAFASAQSVRDAPENT
jgi:oxygen-dependent protoporphyrinogen oxidase